MGDLDDLYSRLRNLTAYDRRDMGRRGEIGNEEARAAAEWWASKLNKPMDNGDWTGSLGDVMIDTMNPKIRASVNEQSLAVFTDALTDGIVTELEAERAKYPDWTGRNYHIGVDYHANGVLAAALAKADIHDLLAPIKTNMHLYPKKVKAAHGYRGAWKVIYGEPIEELTQDSFEMNFGYGPNAFAGEEAWRQRVGALCAFAAIPESDVLNCCDSFDAGEMYITVDGNRDDRIIGRWFDTVEKIDLCGRHQNRVCRTRTAAALRAAGL